jgi:soluble lytic murein transglycosylase-like protein
MNRNYGVVALLCLLAAPLCATADIYQLAPDSEEIVLTNLDYVGNAEILVAGESTPPPAQEQTATAEPAPIAALPYAEEVRQAARLTHVEPALIHAVIATESRHNPRAVSPRGAQGLMQLMPATAMRYGVSNAFDPRQNILAGASYLSELRRQFNGNLELALAAYNAGPGAVIKHGLRIPAFKETRHYVTRVLETYRRLTQPVG